MEWVETTAKTVDAAKDAALDQLGVAADEAEFEVVDEPRAGLFGRMRGEARVRARVKPTPVRPKQERRRRGGGKKKSAGRSDTSNGAAPKGKSAAESAVTDGDGDAGVAPSDEAAPTAAAPRSKQPRQQSGNRSPKNRSRSTQQEKDPAMSNDITDDTPSVSPQEVGDAAVAFMEGLVDAFDATGEVELTVEGTELDVRVHGDGLGLLVGRGGRTLNAVQDLARVAAQRRLGDHDTRLRIDVARYRERRAEALVRFAADVAAQVRDSGSARSLEPMTSADRKVIHDALNDEDGVASRSEGDDPNRRVVVVPA